MDSLLPFPSGLSRMTWAKQLGASAVAALVVLLVALPAAHAQTAPGGGLSVSVGTSTNDPGLHDSFYYGVRVTNGGGSPVSGAVLEVIFPPSFRGEGAVPPSGCTAVPLGLSCPLGTLAANETREIYFPGHFDGLDDGATIARVRDASGAVTVTVERQDNDGDDDDERNRRGDQQFDLPCPGGNLTLSGGSDPNETIGVDDDFEVRLNGTQIFVDSNGTANENPPVKFSADRGDQLRVIAYNSAGGDASIDPLFLHCDSTGEFQVLDENGYNAPCCSDAGTTFYDETFTIGFRSTSGATSVSSQEAKERSEGDESPEGDEPPEGGESTTDTGTSQPE